MAADRAQHVAEVVRPALAAGRDVVTDRYLTRRSPTRATGAASASSAVAALSAFATEGARPRPGRCCWSSRRRCARHASRPAAAATAIGWSGPATAFHERVEAGLPALAAADPARWVVVDGDAPVEDVAARVWDVVSPRLG